MNLLARMREVRTLEGNYQVYRFAWIGVREFNPYKVFPISKYVLSPTLDFLTELNRTICLFGLKDIKRVGDTVIAPPVLEWDGKCLVIVDGLHRLWLAQRRGVTISCIYVIGAARPVIGKPVSWEHVSLLNSLPSDPRSRRDLRDGIKDKPEVLRKYYRDFSFLGSKGRRPTSGQAN